MQEHSFADHVPESPTDTAVVWSHANPSNSHRNEKNSRDNRSPSKHQRKLTPTSLPGGESHDDHGTHTPAFITRDTYVFVLCAALNSCNLGYDVGVSTSVGRLVEKDFGLTRIEREIFIASINFWAMFGSLAAHYFTDTYGRRKTFFIAAVGFIFGLLVTASATSFNVLLLGRLFVGLGVGIGLAIDPLYIAEVTPARFRGELVSWAEVALNVGIVLGFSTELILARLPTGMEWRVMVLLGCIFPTTMMIVIGLNIMPESPRWLVANKRQAEAKQVLERIYPAGYNVDPVVEDIQEALQREELAEKAVGWSMVFHPTPGFRRMLLVGIGTVVAQQAVGIDAIQYYLLDVLDQSGIDSATKRGMVLIFLGLLKLIFAWIGGKLFDGQGRRKLLFTSLLGMMVALLIVALSFFLDSGSSASLTITGLALYISFFSVGMGPGGWLVATEVFSTSIRAKAMSLATFLNRVTATLMASTFLSTANLLGWTGFFLLLCGICLVTLIFLYVFLPETKGRSLEEMSAFFAELTGDTELLETESLMQGAGEDGVELHLNTSHVVPTDSAEDYQDHGGTPSLAAPLSTRGEII